MRGEIIYEKNFAKAHVHLSQRIGRSLNNLKIEGVSLVSSY